MSIEWKDGTVTASIDSGRLGVLSNHEVNQISAKLLLRLAKEIAKHEEYEFDGILTPDFDGNKISLVANFFIP